MSSISLDGAPIMPPPMAPCIGLQPCLPIPPPGPPIGQPAMPPIPDCMLCQCSSRSFCRSCGVFADCQSRRYSSIFCQCSCQASLPLEGVCAPADTDRAAITEPITKERVFILAPLCIYGQTGGQNVGSAQGVSDRQQHTVPRFITKK